MSDVSCVKTSTPVTLKRESRLVPFFKNTTFLFLVTRSNGVCIVRKLTARAEPPPQIWSSFSTKIVQ